MVRELSVAEEPRQHCQRARRQSLVDERFLAIQRLDGRATGQRVFASLGVDDLGIQFAHGPQPAGFPSVARIQWLAENELAAGGVVAEIKPISCAVPGLRQRTLNDASCSARVHTSNEKVDRGLIDPVERPFIEIRRLGPPPCAPEQVDAIDQDRRLVLPNV